MDPNQQQLLLTGGAKDSTYIDDVFSTYVYTGTSNAGRAVNNGIDLAGEGGLTWIKARGHSTTTGGGVENHALFDTLRGVTKGISSNTNGAEVTDASSLTSFNSNGFSLGTGYGTFATNLNNYTYSSWNFRKAPGFFDVVTYTGNGSNRTIAHSLGSVPGLIMIKNVSAGENWRVYHRETKATHNLQLNDNDAAGGSSTPFNDTEPTASVFSVGTDGATNNNGDTIVAYLFAGGESTAATATSCNFLGSASDAQDNKIWVGNASDKTSDFVYGTGDFTMEAWFNPVDSSNAYKRIIHHGHEWNQNNTIGLMWDHVSYNNTITFWSYALNSSNPILTSNAHAFQGSWNHVAITRSSGTFRLFLNGVLESINTSYSDSIEGSETSNYVTIGATHNLNQQECFKGNISNVRIVKGTAVYTTSFRPPTEPLTNITNTKLLCCNGSSTTSATVTPKTLVSDATVTINTTNSPFDDPEGFKFGEEGDQNLIKTGSYIGFGGGGSGSHVDVDLGWEPQWVIIKNSSATSSWNMFDSMRGTPTGGLSDQLTTNTTAAENNYGINQIDFTNRGFKINIEGNAEMNQSGSTHVYIAIRRPDPLIQKPAEVGTDVFTMDTGSGSAAIPTYDSGFPVDYAFTKTFASAGDWYTSARLLNGRVTYIQQVQAEHASGNFIFDSNTGWGISHNSSFQSWMWKRHAGFDVVAFQGTATNPGPTYAHALGKIPELKIIKRRNNAYNWMGGGTVISQAMAGNLTSAKDYYFEWNTNASASSSSNYWSGNDTANHFTVRHGNGSAGGSNDPYLCLLFASVEGISKVGYYGGTGSGLTITTGFSPRFVILKRIDITGDWHVLDTARGWGAGSDQYLALNATQAQASHNIGAPTATGFTLTVDAAYNGAGGKYIYYAHA